MTDVLSLKRRTVRYELADGMRDFMTAFWLVFNGIFAFIVFDHPETLRPFAEIARETGSFGSFVIVFGLVVAIPALIAYGGQYLVNQYVRRRWLWRNTGFIKPRKWAVPRSLLLACGVIVLAVWGITVLIAIEQSDPWLIIRGLYIAISVQFVLMYWIVGRMFDLPRYQIVAYVGAFVTLATLPLAVGPGTFALIVSAAWAALLIASGVHGMMMVEQQQREAADGA